jgi:hypothetical protein
MARSLFTDSLDGVTEADVNAFLDFDIEEGVRLDYKDADGSSKTGIPKDNALKVIIAFANTYGGLLILGVAADKVTNRPVGRDGLPLTRGLEETITAMCSSSITPPVIPEVRICPFKSDPSKTADDRAFIIIRVTPSLAAPHADKENRIHVRVNSQCALADLPTLRFLFERQQRREELTTQLTKTVRARGSSIRQRFKPELDNPGTKQRWAPNQPRIYFELIPLDAPTEILSFDYKGEGKSLDDAIIKRLRDTGWSVLEADILPEPDGLGIVATYIGKKSFVPMDQAELAARPVSAIYFDLSGGVFVDTPAVGAMNNSSVMITQLVRQIGGVLNEACKLFSDHKYSGRLQATLWVDLGNGTPPKLDPTQVPGHRGSSVFLVQASWDERVQHIGKMVNQMTRSWLKNSFGLSWPEGSMPQIDW